MYDAPSGPITPMNWPESFGRVEAINSLPEIGSFASKMTPFCFHHITFDDIPAFSTQKYSQKYSAGKKMDFDLTVGEQAEVNSKSFPSSVKVPGMFLDELG